MLGAFGAGEVISAGSSLNATILEDYSVVEIGHRDTRPMRNRRIPLLLLIECIPCLEIQANEISGVDTRLAFEARL